MDYDIREFDADESERLLRQLRIALGVNGADAALQVIADNGAGIFKAERR